MIATDVSWTETNDRCWGSGGIFFLRLRNLFGCTILCQSSRKGRSSTFQRPVFAGVVVVNCVLRQTYRDYV